MCTTAKIHYTSFFIYKQGREIPVPGLFHTYNNREIGGANIPRYSCQVNPVADEWRPLAIIPVGYVGMWLYGVIGRLFGESLWGYDCLVWLVDCWGKACGDVIVRCDWSVVWGEFVGMWLYGVIGRFFGESLWGCDCTVWLVDCEGELVGMWLYGVIGRLLGGACEDVILRCDWSVVLGEFMGVWLNGVIGRLLEESLWGCDFTLWLVSC